MTTRKNPHIGSSFDSWLDEKRVREEVTAVAVKSVIGCVTLETLMCAAAALRD